MKKVISILLLLYALPAFAQQTCPPGAPLPSDDQLVCWTNATNLVNEDGSDAGPIPATGPKALFQTEVQKVQVGASANCSVTNPQAFKVTADVLQMFFENLPAGKHCYRARHITTDLTTSNWTSWVSKVSNGPTKAKTPTLTIY